MRQAHSLQEQVSCPSKEQGHVTDNGRSAHRLHCCCCYCWCRLRNAQKQDDDGWINLSHKAEAALLASQCMIADSLMSLPGGTSYTCSALQACMLCLHLRDKFLFPLSPFLGMHRGTHACMSAAAELHQRMQSQHRCSIMCSPVCMFLSLLNA